MMRIRAYMVHKEREQKISFQEISILLALKERSQKSHEKRRS